MKKIIIAVLMMMVVVTTVSARRGTEGKRSYYDVEMRENDVSTEQMIKWYEAINADIKETKNSIARKNETLSLWQSYIDENNQKIKGLENEIKTLKKQKLDCKEKKDAIKALKDDNKSYKKVLEETKTYLDKDKVELRTLNDCKDFYRIQLNKRGINND